MPFSKSDVDWFSGVYEGEGYCHRHGKSIRLVITQRDDWLCKKLQSLFGGTVNVHRDTSVSNPQNCWRLYGPPAVELIMAALPRLSPKRQNQILSAYYGDQNAL